MAYEGLVVGRGVVVVVVVVAGEAAAWAGTITDLLFTRLLTGTQTGLLGSHINLPYRAVSKHLGTMGE